MADINQRIIRALIRGEDSAYAAVVDALYRPVYTFARRLCGDVALAEDITQETFLAAWQGIDSFKGRSKFTTWVFGIAYRQFLRLRDKHAEFTVSLGEEHMQDLAGDACEVSESVHLSMELSRALGGLSDAYRQVVLLVHIQGFTYREAAYVLDIPIGTVKSRMNSAYEALRDLLKESEVSGDEMREPESLLRQ